MSSLLPVWALTSGANLAVAEKRAVYPLQYRLNHLAAHGSVHIFGWYLFSKYVICMTATNHDWARHTQHSWADSP